VLPAGRALPSPPDRADRAGRVGRGLQGIIPLHLWKRIVSCLSLTRNAGGHPSRVCEDDTGLPAHPAERRRNYLVQGALPLFHSAFRFW